MAEKKQEQKTKQEKKKEEKKKKKEKNLIGIAKGKDLPISTKYAVAICSFIKGKKPQEAITLLEQVLKKKIAVPMKGEIPHKPNMPKGKPSGKYPIRASKVFIKLLRNLIANTTIKGLDIDSLIITKAIANKAARPSRGTRIAFGRKHFKRSHIELETQGIKIEIKKRGEKEKKEKEEKKEEKKEERKEEKPKEKEMKMEKEKEKEKPKVKNKEKEEVKDKEKRDEGK